MATQAPTADVFERTWTDPRGLLGVLSAVQNDILGKRIMATAFAFFVLGGLNALLMRTQLATPESTLIDPTVYNRAFTLHGSTMMYLFAVPFLEGLAVIALPPLLGARDFPFPRLTAFTFWTLLLGGLLFYSGIFFQAVPDTGWFAYVPLSGPRFAPGLGIDFFLLGLSVAEIGGIAAGVEIVIAVLKMRAPGMSLTRMPLFAWAWLVTGFMMLFAFTPLIVGSLLMELDRKVGTQFFDPAGGGDPLLWQHLFWIFGHPEVYLQFIPATGIVSMIVPVFARSRIVGYPMIALAIIATGFLSFGLWVHHMFAVGLPEVGMAFFTVASMLIAIPSGIQILAWLATIWNGRPVWRTPLLFIVGFMVLFVLGGITGVMVASVPLDLQVHDTFFVVAHFHYVLIGGVVFPIFAAIYYWLPKFTGRMLNERLGQVHFWLFFIGFNITFFPMHIAGLLGMPRRVYTFSSAAGWDVYNLLATIGAYILAAGVMVFILNVLWSLQNGAEAGDDPWHADTLEWSRPSPTPNYGYRLYPIVHSRHPLWDQERLDQGDPKVVSLVQDLGKWPTTWRAQLVTSTVYARPEELIQMAGPSLWPFIAAVAVFAIFVALIFDAYLIAALGAFVSVIALIGWHSPEEKKVLEGSREHEAFERKHGIPVGAAGGTAVPWWGMLLALLIVGVALASFVFSYFYLRLSATTWPPPGFALPDLQWALIGTAVVLASLVSMYWARRSIREGNASRLKLGLGIALLLGVAFLGILGYDLLRQALDHRAHAYASLFNTILVFQITLVALGLIISAVVQYWAWRGHYGPRRHLAVTNSLLFWSGVTLSWIVVLATLYLAPYVI